MTEGNEEQMEEQIENDAYLPRSRMDQLQEEFHMSAIEVDELTKFIASSQNNNMLGILEELIKCESLNTRQKVAFAHAIGIFRTEESMSTRIRSSQS